MSPRWWGVQQRVVAHWVTPFPGFKIVGNVYYVGTQDLAAYLIATNEGLILINTGEDGSYQKQLAEERLAPAR